MVRGIGLERTRRSSQPLPESLDDETPLTASAASPPAGATGSGRRGAEAANAERLEAEAALHDDGLDGVFLRLGAQLARPMADGDDTEAPAGPVAGTVRLLLQAFSAGGSLSSVGTPEQAHAARTVLAAVLDEVLRDTDRAGARAGGGWSVPGPPPLDASGAHERAAPLAQAASALLPLLVNGQGHEAVRWLRRYGERLPAAQRDLLQLLVQGATRRYAAGVPVPDDAMALVLGDEPVEGPLVPIRLGLALLPDSPVTRLPEPSVGGRFTPVAVETAGTGWGGARVAGAELAGRPAADGRSAGIVAVLLGAAALGAAVNGATLVATVLALGAVAMGARRAPPPDRPRGND
jgi:hypothetical protein